MNLTVNGYSSVKVVDRLVGEAFCPDYAPHLRAVYKNGNRADVRASNLKWVSVADVSVPPRGNAKRTSKLTPEQVLEIREAEGTLLAIAAKYGVNDSTISAIKRRATWQHL